MRIIIAVTGASGMPYATTLLRELKAEKHIIVSENAVKVIERESDIGLEEMRALADLAHDPADMTAPMASGSARFDAMVIVPCSMSTLSKIACGIADNLICRTAQVFLKERRRLVLVPRETPLSSIHLENMKRLSDCGATVLAAMPAFYTRPSTVADMVNFVVGRILDSLGVEHSLYEPWE
ncbi:MAG: UbiX family flavin prenyltransferase [Thermoplasmata archaeon]|nr:UbiX family flavin prenyltransferase [Thermoplasmata archaeon]